MKALTAVLDWMIARKPWQIMIVFAAACFVLGVAFTDYWQSSCSYIEILR